MPSVRKYPLKFEPKQVVKLEGDALILPGVYRRWGEPVLYVLGEHKKLDTKNVIRMFATGAKFAYDALTMTYLGNCINEVECFHFWKVTEEA